MDKDEFLVYLYKKFYPEYYWRCVFQLVKGAIILHFIIAGIVGGLIWMWN